MRIAHLIHHVSRRAAGVLEVVQAQTRALAARGHTVAVFGYDHPEELPDAPRPAFDPAVEVHSTSTWLSVQQGYSPRLEALVASFRPDVLHTHGVWTGLSLTSLGAQKKTRAPLVVTPHGMLDPWALDHRGLKKRLAQFLFERRHLSRASLLQALTAAEATDLAAWGLPGRTIVIPNGVWPPPERGSGSPPWIRTERRRVLLYLNRIHDKKGLFELVDAFERLAPELSEWRLVIAGFGKPRDEARLQERLETARATEFVGPQGPEARHACYEHATAFVLPSRSEGLPLTVLEAWSHGKLALISPACHLDAGYAAGAALAVTPEPSSLEAGLRQLAALPDEELARRGRAAQKLAREEFSWPVIGQTLESEYQRLVDGAESKRAEV